MKLYYAPGTISIAVAIALEEAGLAYDTVKISFADADQTKPDYTAINPKGRVPVLETPDGFITENPAILEYIAATHPQAGFVPEDAYTQAQARALAAYICATAHVAFAHKQRGRRWAENDSSLLDMQQMVPANLQACAAFLEADLALAPWALGAEYCFCDPYLVLLGRWLSAVDLTLDAYPKLAQHRDALLARPATQAALKAQGLT